MYLKGNPWNPGYAIPKNVRRERPFSSPRISRGAKRGTISAYTKEVPAFRAGYVLPANVKAEIPGQGVIISKGLPRGYVDTKLVPDGLGSLGCDDDHGSLGGSIFSKRTLAGHSLDRSSLGGIGMDIFTQQTTQQAISQAASSLPDTLPGLTAAETSLYKKAMKHPSNGQSVMLGKAPFYVFKQGDKSMGKFYTLTTKKLSIRELDKGAIKAISDLVKGLVCGSGLSAQGARAAAASQGIDASLVSNVICGPQAPTATGPEFPILPLALIGAAGLALVLIKR